MEIIANPTTQSTRKDFHHPYQPYEIQYEFMTALYECIEQGQIGIFESPTGTGKSLSLICGSLTWLRDHQRNVFEMQVSVEAGDEPDWIIEHARRERTQSFLQHKNEFEDRLARIRAKELRQKQRYEHGESQAKRIKVGSEETAVDNDDEARFALDDYDSDDEGTEKQSTSQDLSVEGLSTTSRELMQKLGLASEPLPGLEDDIALTDEVKIFYCSRTHSQLSQFTNELRRVKIPPGAGPGCAKEGISPVWAVAEEIKHLSLGSRKNLCINPQVSKLGNPTAISERCLELQQPKTAQALRCAFLPNKENETLVNDFRDHTLAKIRDIEDLGLLGKKLGICPYYASRSPIKPSEIVTLPYPLLLQKSAREALEISLKGHVVIIDEAHNLMEAISSIHSIVVSFAQLKRSRAQLGIYLHRFRNKLKGKNRVYVTQVVRLLDSLIGYLEIKAANRNDKEAIVDVGDLMTGKGVDQMNLYKLTRYLQESRLARKVEGYITHAEEQKTPIRDGKRSATTPLLTHIQNFIQALTNPAAEGRFFYSKFEEDGLCLRYLLLDPTFHFKEVVEEARAVILAGGTMSPMDDYIRQLFAYVEPDRLKILSCGHVIPKENLIAWPVTNGVDGKAFDFTYEKRNSAAMIDVLGKTLSEMTKSVPDGVVVFFASYAYLDQVTKRWQQPSVGGVKNIWSQLSEQKGVFRESKEKAGVDDVLSEYSKAIDAGKGGLLLSVIGGKMSEGINFSDKLARGVVVVGLPFPNMQSAEWVAKLEYVEKRAVERGESQGNAKAVARGFYENACMRAVNQSIGRAIRHQNDYACIMLLDRRYDTPRIKAKLPGWIRGGLREDTTTKPFSDVTDSLKAFFRAKEAP